MVKGKKRGSLSLRLGMIILGPENTRSGLVGALCFHWNLVQSLRGHGLKSLRENPRVQFLSRPRMKGCPISRSFFARYGIPRLPIYILRLSRNCRSRSAVSHISRKTSEIWGTLSFVVETEIGPADSPRALKRQIKIEPFPQRWSRRLPPRSAALLTPLKLFVFCVRPCAKS
jgi:hypothetical protein